MSDRTGQIMLARCYLAESRKRTAIGHRVARAFAFTLLEWAGNARRRAAALPMQRGLFA